MNPIDILYPPRCVLCNAFLPRNVYTCDACSRMLLRAEPIKRKLRFAKRAVALLPYEEPARGSIHRFKFKGLAFYANPYGDWLAACVKREMPDDFDVVTWAPVSFWRRWQRMYDQGQLLAQRTAKRMGCKCIRCLKKFRHIPAQSGIKSPEQRRANVLGAYRAYRPERFAGKRVLLIDDVLTTGATIEECARTLLSAGASTVVCAAVAAAK